MPQAHGIDRAFPASEPGVWMLETPESKEWIARRSATRTTALYPGTAVRWGERIYEVVEHEVIPPGMHRYRLSAWEERLTVRTIESYDEHSEAARREDRRHRAALRHARWLILALAPLAGHLPAREQERLEREYDVSSTLLTVASALPLFFFGAIATVWLAIMGFTGIASPVPETILFLGVYFFLESGMRLASAISGNHPAGSFLGAAAFELWRLAKKRR
jgi:hypothetical protein